MVRSNESQKHHWWPVGLQSYWADKAGDVSWIEPDGKVEKKRFSNRKIGLKYYGHTMSKGTDWEYNFEGEFDIDNEVHRIIISLQNLKPLGWTPREFFALIKMLWKKNKSLRDMCKFYDLDEEVHRGLLLLIHSLLIRSPGNRFRYEAVPTMVGLPADEDVGKANLEQLYRIAKKLCRQGLISNQYFVLLHSPLRKFIFGDGSLDWFTAGLVASRINGKTLLPLTPHLCVYFCTPMSMRSTPNCASLSVAPWMVDRINEITQIYSRDMLFFLGSPPKLTEAFRQHKFLSHKEKTDELIDMLDEIVGNKRYRNIVSIGMSGIN